MDAPAAQRGRQADESTGSRDGRGLAI